MKSKSFVFPKPDLEGNFVYRVPGQNIDSNCYFRFYRGVLDLLILTELVDNFGALITDSLEYLLPELRKYISQIYKIELSEHIMILEHSEADHFSI